MESLGDIRIHVAVPSTGESIARIAALIPVAAECLSNLKPLFIPELDILPYSNISPLCIVQYILSIKHAVKYWLTNAIGIKYHHICRRVIHTPS